MNRKEIIALAEKVGLLVKDENFPYNAPAQQRLISRLERFAANAHAVGFSEGIEEVIRQQEELKDFEEKGKSSSDFQSD